MATKDKALKMAIEFIDEITNAAGKYPYVDKTSLVADSYAMSSKLKEALEQPTMTYEDGFAHGYEAHRAEQALEQPAWKGLSNDMVLAIGEKCEEKNRGILNWIDFYNGIDDMLKDKNHG